MNKRFTSAVVAGVVAVGMSVPAVGFAAGGGKSHAPCSTHKTYGHHKGTSGKKKGSSQGRKCGKRV